MMPASAPVSSSAIHSSHSGSTWDANQSRTSSSLCTGAGITSRAAVRARNHRSAAARASAGSPRRMVMGMSSMMHRMDLGFDGRAMLVTGAASGIGRATAEALAREGARIVASDIDTDAGAAAAAALREAGADVRFVAGDVAGEEAVGALVAAALDAFGRL